jgi:serine/threonine protein kinase
LRGKFDVRSEVYSLGLTLYEFATLRPAFIELDRTQLIQQIIEKLPPLPRSINPGIPRKLETIILKAIEKEPKNRYQSAGALAEDLQRFLSGDPLRARRSTPLAAFLHWCNQNAAVVRLASALLILLLLIPAAASIDFVRSSRTRLQQEQELEQAQRERAQALDEKRIAEAAAAESQRRIELLERELQRLQTDSTER